MLALILLTVGSIPYLVASSHCYPAKQCTAEEDTDGSSSAQWICYSNGTRCEASYDNGLCAGEPTSIGICYDKDEESYVACSGCSSFMKTRVYPVETTDTTCSSKDIYYENIQGTGCYYSEYEWGWPDSSRKYSCTGSSTKYERFNGTGFETCSGIPYSSAQLSAGCIVPEEGYRAYLQVLHCGTCSNKPSLFILGLVFVVIISIIN